MPTPTKPISVLKTEKKSHRTKAELEKREKQEKALESDVEIKERPEVRDNKTAHKEFLRVTKLLKNIEKNDALYEGAINRYCLLTAECLEFEERISKLTQSIEKLESDYDEDKIEADFYYNKLDSLQKSIINYDRQIMTKRKMLLDLEKENIMTIASALRSIPKKAEKDETTDPMENLFKSRFG